MDPADVKEFLELVRALWTNREKKTNPLRRLKVSNKLIDFFYEKPVHLLITDTSHILEEVERVNQAALEEIFGQRFAQVAAGAASSLVPPATPVPAPPIRRWKSVGPTPVPTALGPTSSGHPPDHHSFQAPRRRSPGASCTKTCVDFLLKHGIRTNQNALQSTKISGCISVCAPMNPSTFLLYIPINGELSAHVGVPDSSLSTPLLKYANHI